MPEPWRLNKLTATMAALAEVRPVFQSEADFQHAFAWQLHQQYLHARIRLETRAGVEARRLRGDRG